MPLPGLQDPHHVLVHGGLPPVQPRELGSPRRPDAQNVLVVVLGHTHRDHALSSPFEVGSIGSRDVFFFFLVKVLDGFLKVP